jgi:hypothetical protein
MLLSFIPNPLLYLCLLYLTLCSISDVQPIKRAISTWVTKWLYMHTQYLQDFVGGRLSELNDLLHEVCDRLLGVFSVDFQCKCLYYCDTCYTI